MYSMPDFLPVIPEMFLFGMACVILLVDLFLTEDTRNWTYSLSLGTVIGTGWLVFRMFGQPDTVTFGGMFIADGLAHLLKLAACVTTAVVFIYSRDYLKIRNLLKGEFFVIGLLALLGMMIIMSAHNFITVYLGLELLSLSLYTLVAMDRDAPVASEAAMKYFVLGAIASGLLLYGMSILYGLTGTLDVAETASVLLNLDHDNLALVLGVTFIVAGLAFKLGAVPFHMWLPDVYHGAPTAITLFVGSAPKLAAFALFIRMLVDPLSAAQVQWQEMLIALAVLSMAIGSIVAIAQTNIKRMLAYSAISHVGFILLGILAGSPEGYQSALFYTLTYVLMATAGFGMIILLSREGFEADKLDDFRGLNDRSPWFAAMMSFVMFGMAGVPPFVGFYAKLSVLWAVIAAGYTWLAVAAVLFAVISAYYYLRVVKLMYFDSVEKSAQIEAPGDIRAVLSINGLALLALGIFPGSLMAICARVMGL